MGGQNRDPGCYENFIITINNNVSIMFTIMIIKVIDMKVINCKNAEKITK